MSADRQAREIPRRPRSNVSSEWLHESSNATCLSARALHRINCRRAAAGDFQGATPRAGGATRAGLDQLQAPQALRAARASCRASLLDLWLQQLPTQLSDAQSLANRVLG